MPGIARISDTSSHNGIFVSSSQDVTINGLGVLREGDMHVCPIEGHGTTPIVVASLNATIDGVGIARLGDITGCGAIISSASTDTNAN